MEDRQTAMTAAFGISVSDDQDSKKLKAVVKVGSRVPLPAEEVEGRSEDVFRRSFPSTGPRWCPSFRIFLVGLAVAFVITGCSGITKSVEKKEEAYGKESPNPLLPKK